MFSCDTLYWYYSSSSQTIAALIGFMMASYVFAVNSVFSYYQDNEELHRIALDVSKKSDQE